jgi:hypothetical protein
MMKSVIGAALLSLFAITPAFAVAPECQSQLDALRGQLAEKAGAKTALSAKYDQAQRLCSANKDEEAQALARQMREELAGRAPTEGSASGSTAAPAPTDRAGQPKK